jgi:hypothetical protein
MNIFAFDLATRTGWESKVDGNRKEMCILSVKNGGFSTFFKIAEIPCQ